MRATALRILGLLTLAVPALLQGAAEVRTINAATDLPENFSSAWKKGDLCVMGGDSLVLFGGVSRPTTTRINYPASDVLGCVIALVPAGKSLINDIAAGAPVLRLKDRTEYPAYASLTATRDSIPGALLSLEAKGAVTGESGLRGAFRTLYHILPGGRIDIVSRLTNTGASDMTDLGYSLWFYAHTSYSFSPFDPENHPDLNFRVWQKKGLYLAWVNLNPVEKSESPRPGSLKPGESCEVRYSLLAAAEAKTLLESAYGIRERELHHASIAFKDVRGKNLEIIVQDAFSPAVFFRSFLDSSPFIEIPLPAGFYRVRGHFFPAVVEALMAVEKRKDPILCTLEGPPQGKLRIRIRNSANEHVPGKVTFVGLDPTRTPYFEPDNPVETGRAWETLNNSVFPGEGGDEVALPAGTYLITASRGPEYTIDEKAVEVLAGETPELVFRVDRVVRAPGYLSLDPHLHTRHSDGALSISERVRSIVAEGLDLAIATDHNFITDYGPELRKSGLDLFLAAASGVEVTPRNDYVHFQILLFPFQPGRPNNGAIVPQAATVAELFRSARTASPGALLQLNHPRDGGLGLFRNAGLDPESAAFVEKDNFDLSFDLLEVMNGPVPLGNNREAVEDWLHLLNAGYRYPISASSDSHSADGGEPGYSRVYIRAGGDGGNRPDWPAVLQALRQGRAFISNGPLLELRVNEKYESGDAFTDKTGNVTVRVAVRSAPWVSVDEVRLIINGERRVVFPVRAAERAPAAFFEEVTLHLSVDSFITAEALGRTSLYPVVQQPSRSGSIEDAALPYALANPVFIDVDGNGRFDPPRPLKIAVRAEKPKEETSAPERSRS